MALVKDMRENYGVFCSIVVYPVIPKGMIISTTHFYRNPYTEEDIQITLDAFSAVREKIGIRRLQPVRTGSACLMLNG
ncbi:MAG: hypothetical protein R2778_03580 [Saprospiraceae bacterium]